MAHPKARDALQIDPYLTPLPQSSLTLLTSVLSASSNWLVMHIVAAILAGPRPHDNDNQNTPSVILISFLRDWTFWKDTAKRVRCDLNKRCNDGRFLFIDGLSKLSGNEPVDRVQLSDPLSKVVLRKPDIRSIEKEVLTAIENFTDHRHSQIHLVIDGLDFFLASTGQEIQTLLDAVSSWREQVYATIILSAADTPITQSRNTALETNHAALTASLAHQATTIISLRVLSTGVAKDISGVLRISKGPASGDPEVGSPEEREYLYFVSADLNVSIFERGASL